MQRNNSKEFESIVKNLLIRLDLGTFWDISKSTSLDFDFIVGDKYAIEVKYYRTSTPQFDLLARASRILNAQARSLKLIPVLIISAILTKEQKVEFENNYSVTIFDGVDLLYNSISFDDLVGDIQKYLGDEALELNSGLKRHSRNIKSHLQSTRLNNAENFSNGDLDNDESVELLIELQSLECGNGPPYEDICIKIIKYLFGSHFENYLTQVNSDDGLHRYDLIARATPKTEFWKFIINEVNSRYVVFEFKNYCDSISQGQVLTTEKYLLSQALRKCAFIISRIPPSEAALKMARGAIREHGKLLMLLIDDDLIKMMEMKTRGEDPTDYLFNKADEIFMSLSR